MALGPHCVLQGCVCGRGRVQGDMLAGVGGRGAGGEAHRVYERGQLNPPATVLQVCENSLYACEVPCSISRQSKLHHLCGPVYHKMVCRMIITSCCLQRRTLFQAMQVTDMDAAAGSCQVHKGLTDAGAASLSILA